VLTCAPGGNWWRALYSTTYSPTTFLDTSSDPVATGGVSINVRGIIVDPSNNIVLGDADYPLVANATDSITFNVDGYNTLSVYDGYVEITGDLTVSGDINATVGGDLSGSLPNPSVVDLTITGEEQGSVLYFDGSNWVQLPPGDDGYALITHDTGANPTWGAVSGSSVITSVFTRVGDVVAAIDDYSASQIDNDSTVTGEQVSDALEYLDGYIGDVYTLPVGGDLSGSLPNPLVTDLTITSEEQGSVLYFDGANWVQLAPGDDGYVLTTHDTGADPTWEEASGGTGSGDVVGPAGATDNAIVRYDGATGKLVQNSGVLIDDSDNITNIRTATFNDWPTIDGYVTDGYVTVDFSL